MTWDSLMRVAVPDGVTLRDPDTGAEYSSGEANVPRSTYWIRRVRDGSVTELVDAPKAEPIAEAKPTAKRKRNTQAED